MYEKNHDFYFKKHFDLNQDNPARREPVFRHQHVEVVCHCFQLPYA